MLDFKKDKDWLMDAVPMKAVKSSLYRLQCLVSHLFGEVSQLIKITRKYSQKEALMAVLMNLMYADSIDKPVRYSRDKNRYTADRRYRKRFFKYDRVIPIIDALERLAYLDQSSFYFDHEAHEGFQTRMWGTPKLWRLCGKYRLSQHDAVIPERFEDEEVITLRDKRKINVGYRETAKTRQMRKDLERYNDFIDRNKISVRLAGSTLVDNRFLTETLYRNIRNGKVWIEHVVFNSSSNLYNYTVPLPFFTKHRIPFHKNPYSILSKLLDSIYKDNPHQITHTKRRIAMLRKRLRRYWSDEHRFQRELEQRSLEMGRIPWKERQAALAEEYRLQDIGVDKLVFVLEQERLRRVFNRRSWACGGRAYGAFHQDRLRKHMREGILINDAPTIEIDFSAFHILMLYHMEGIEYQENPYSVCEGPEMRPLYKAVGLIAINAKDEREAMNAIREELHVQGLKLPRREKPLKTLVRTFRETHSDIEQYLFSDVGVKLQNTDAEIMNAILVRLMDHGILGLSVFDSVIVQREHEALARTVMTEEYERVMGYKPRF